jgi:hypothetical protein
MAAATYSTLNMEGVDINNVFYLDTKTLEYPAPPFIAGTQAFGTDGSAWVYCTSSVSLGIGAVCVVSEVPGSWSVALIGGGTIAATAAPIGDLVGVVSGSQGSLVVGAPSGTQTGAYFWLQRAGNCQALNTAASTTKDAQLFSSATVAGRVSSSGGGVGTTYTINGMVVSQATGSTAGPNTAVLNWPTVGSSF